MRRAAAAFLAACGLAATASADDWPGWRGAGGQGQCAEKNLPLKWGPNENVRWKVPLPDTGSSTPAVWGDKVFVTQASEKTVWPPRGNNGGPAAARKRSLLCFARADGKLLWQKDVIYEAEESTHPTNPFCSASPAVDGERVVVSHGSAGLHAYDLTGRELCKVEQRPGGGAWGSMLHADGRLYVPTRGGTTLVLAARPQFELLASNRLGEHTDSSLAVSNGEIFIRTYKQLWCIAERK